jgi:hypothetical protein
MVITHLHTCKTGHGVIDKHNSIVKCLVTKMKSVALTCSFEAKNLNNPSAKVQAIFLFRNSIDMEMLILMLSITTDSQRCYIY